MESDLNHSPEPNNTSRTWRDWLVVALLVLILILGAAFRLTGLDWDQDQHLHPDERFLTMVETAISLPGIGELGRKPPVDCNEWGGYFNTPCSPLNPYNHDFGLFVYGTFPIFVTRAVAEVISQTGYGEIYLVGRLLSALFDLSTVLLIFFIGRRMYDTRVALLGALFLAASVLDIQQSHFFTVDTFTNVPILIAFWYAMALADGKKWTAFVYAGAAFGLALAGRINIAPFAAVLVAASALRAYLAAEASRQHALGVGPETLSSSQPTTVSERSVGPFSVSVGWRGATRSLEDLIVTHIGRALLGLAGAAIVALIVFRIAQPYAANGPSFISPVLPRLDLSRGIVNAVLDVALSWAGGVNLKFADNMQYISQLVAGQQDYPPGHQWTNRTPYLFPLENMLLWGLGLPLGLAAWAGFLLALYRLVRYREWRYLLIVVWVGVTFGYTGQQWVKTLRYFLQIYPFLALLAGYFLVALWDRVTADRRPLTVVFRLPSAVLRLAVGIIALIVIGYTLFWASAFTSVYTRPVSRVTASRWIYENVPRGSMLANEHWDDPLPLRIDAKDPFGGMYRSLSSSPPDGEMHWYDEDTPEKRTSAINWLDEADYIILSSNRLYGSIPRLPMRYPMTTQYYQWLFDGTLGFDRVAEFTSRPQFLGIEVNDDDSEEAFTVYDHPKVLIFKKSPRYSRENTAKLLNSVDITEVYRFWPREATQAPTALLLKPVEREAQGRGGTWSEIFNPDDWVNRIPVAVWLVLIEILGWLVFPIAFVIFRALSDRGYIFAKALGALLPAWGAWMLASVHVLPFSRESITLVLALIAGVSAFVVWRHRHAVAAFLRERRMVVLVEEIMFLAFFSLFVAIRYGNPDLWHQAFGGEKLMDFAHLNAVIRSTWFPPYDPWFAGGYLNYYYFGQVINATLIRLTGIVPEVGYNLALPMYFALTAMGAFSVAFNLVASRTRALRSSLFAGALGAIFVAIIGNLGQLVFLGQTFLRIGGGDPKGSPLDIIAGIGMGIWRVLIEHQPFEVGIGNWYWNATRIIPDTINEFPFFTFLYADLHAHLMALPFTLLALGVAINFVVRERDDDVRLPFWPYLQVSPTDVAEIIAASFVLGALRAINFADFLTYLLVIACALPIGEYARRRLDWEGIFAFAWRLIAIFVMSGVLFQPFVGKFATAYLNIELWKGNRTGLGEYLIVHGIFLFVIATFLALQMFNTKARREVLINWIPLIIVMFIVLEGTFIFGNLFVFAVAFPLLVLTVILLLRPDLDASRRFIVLLIAAGLAMTMVVELVVYKGDIGRMNTVFKFYLQVWVFFALASAAALVWYREQALDSGQRTAAEEQQTPLAPRSSSPVALVCWIFFGLLVFVGILYPITATRAKVNDRFVFGMPAGLNGMDFLRTAVYQDHDYDMVLEYERQAFEWLRANIVGSPVILEGNAPLYHWASRVSAYTGLPTVIGWDWHQKQQRSIIDGSIVDRRQDAVRTVYNTHSAEEALAILERFGVSYIYVGEVEHAFYDAAGLAKFDGMARAGQLRLVYQNDRVKIYKID